MLLHIYILKNNTSFERMMSLQGHSDWIRSIELITFTYTLENACWASQFQPGDLIIASGSQDRFIRLWKVSVFSQEQQENVQELMEGQDGLGIGQDGMKINLKAHVVQLSEGDHGSSQCVFSVC